jgi:hypothetical protein
MTDRDELHTLRTSAKRLARALRLPHHQALDIVATRCEQSHWNALTAAWNNGWRPTAEQLEALRKPDAADTPSRGVSSVSASEGVIAGEPYHLDVGFDYVLIGGRGWAIHLGHAPSKAAEIERYTSPNPLDNEAFLKEVMKVAQKAADRVREEIAQDWPRRSTKPDKDGCVVHPLLGGVSADWYCLHCDARSTGADMANNMWHCPNCSATPLDMHPNAWWKEPVDRPVRRRRTRGQ